MLLTFPNIPSPRLPSPPSSSSLQCFLGEPVINKVDYKKLGIYLYIFVLLWMGKRNQITSEEDLRGITVINFACYIVYLSVDFRLSYSSCVILLTVIRLLQHLDSKFDGTGICLTIIRLDNRQGRI